MTSFRLRLYYNADLVEKSPFSVWRMEFEVLKSLLEEARRRLGVKYELFPFRHGDEPFIYKAHFTSRPLKRSGCDAYLKGARLHGVLAFVYEDEVVWSVECLRDDFEFLRKKALEAGFERISIGFLKAIIENPSYYDEVIRKIENVIREYLNEAKDELIISFIMNKIDELRGSAMILNAPLGIKSIGVKAIKADVLVLYGVKGLKPGLYAIDENVKSRFWELGLDIMDLDENTYRELQCTAIDIISILIKGVDINDIARAILSRELARIEFGVNDVKSILAFKGDEPDTDIKALAYALQVDLIRI